LKGLAEERNRIGLGVGLRETGTVIGGVRLPSEKYCLTGLSWGLKEEWDSDGEDGVEGDADADADAARGGDVEMGQLDGAEDFGEAEDDDGFGSMEDVFGGEDALEGDGGGGEDEEMGD